VKTNAVRLLERAGIAFRLLQYAYDEDDLAAERVARALRLPERQVFKTLAVQGDQKQVLLALIPAGTELDLKALAAASGSRSCHLLPLREVQPVTGYVRGGVSPIGTRKPLATFIDESALAQTEVSISAGLRGWQILIAPADLIRFTGAVPARLARPV